VVRGERILINKCLTPVRAWPGGAHPYEQILLFRKANAVILAPAMEFAFPCASGENRRFR
jgi:hypothetical protein